jgi:DNA-binding transcriptional MerR regulator
MVDVKQSGQDKDRLLTVGQAAKELEVTPATLRNWDRARKLTAHRHPINGYRLYRAADIEALKNEIRGKKQ